MYDQGVGVEVNKEKVLYWYSQAQVLSLAQEEEDEFMVDQYYLASIYAEGDGVKVDKKKALYWYTKAAEQGYSEAQYNLGLMYHHGDGVKKDIVLAKRYFKQACSLGFDKGCDDYNSLK